MKKIVWHCASFLLASIVCFGVGYKVVNAEFISCISIETLFNDGVPMKNVSIIFKHLGFPVTSLQEANEFAQKNLLRKGERWDVQEQKEWHAIKEKKEELLEDLKALHMIDEIKPAHHSYTYILLMGGLKKRVEMRLNYLAELKQNGLEFTEIVLLGGERELLDVEKEGLPESVKTEADMMMYVCSQHPNLKNEKVRLVNAPMNKNSDGTLTRPNTDDTIIYFEKTAPADGSCLVISNNPYTLRQTRVTQRLLDQKRFPTDGAGEKINAQTIDIVMLMDEFARLIYEEYKQQS